MPTMNGNAMTCKIASTSLEVVGNTPMVYLNRVTEGCCAKVAVKLEYMNPSCSVKDRVADAMIKAAEKEGKIRPSLTTLIEPTSGNNGISLAHVAAIKGYNLILVMPDNTSAERRIVPMALGAEVVLTKAGDGIKGAIAKAKELAEKIPNSFIPNQFKNAANPQAHFETTGPEIWEQTGGKIDIGVFGVGSGGLLTGIGRYLLQKNPAIEIVACEPEESAILSGGSFGPHRIPGMGVGFVPPVLDTTLYKRVIRVHSDDAIAMTRRLAREEGIFAGVSSGANVFAALRLAKERENEGKLIVTVLSSFGERYLSSPLYSNISEKAMALKVEKTEESLVRIPFASY